MRREREHLHAYAATLQCVAEAFREQGSGQGHQADLRRFATLLDHMAASLLVPGTPALAVVAGRDVSAPQAAGER